MGLSSTTDRHFGIRKVLNTTDTNPEAESDGIRHDVAAAVWGAGTEFPTVTWPGRQFTRTDLGGVYTFDGDDWRQASTPIVAGGTPLVGAAWDGLSPLQMRVGHALVTTSAAGTGSAPLSIQAFPNGILFAAVQLVQSTAVAVKVRHSGQAPAPTLSKLELLFELDSGVPVLASSQHRIAYYVIGW